MAKRKGSAKESKILLSLSTQEIADIMRRKTIKLKRGDVLIGLELEETLDETDIDHLAAIRHLSSEMISEIEDDVDLDDDYDDIDDDDGADGADDDDEDWDDFDDDIEEDDDEEELD